MNNEMVAHAWAHGRSGKGSNFRTDGIELISYYTQIGLNLDGVFYLSADNMSPSTSKQLSYARRAVSYNYFSTPAFRYNGSDPARTHKAMIDPAAARAVQELETCLSSNRRAATKQAAIQQYIQRRQEIIEHAGRFNVAVNMPEIDTTPEAIAAYQAAKAEAARKLTEAQAKAARLQQRKDKREYNAWLTEGLGRCPRSFQTYGADQFTIKNGDTIHTSQGAECPLDHAKKAIRFYLSRSHYVVAENGKGRTYFDTYHTNGHKVPLGIFTLDQIDEAGNVKAGCHMFSAAEIKRFINQWMEVLGL